MKKVLEKDGRNFKKIWRNFERKIKKTGEIFGKNLRKNLWEILLKNKKDYKKFLENWLRKIFKKFKIHEGN